MFQIVLSVTPPFDLGTVTLRLMPSLGPDLLLGQSIQLDAAQGVIVAAVLDFYGLELFDFKLSLALGDRLEAGMRASSVSTYGGLYIQVVPPLGDQAAMAVGHLRHTGWAKPTLVCPDDSSRKIDCPGVLHCTNLVMSC